MSVSINYILEHQDQEYYNCFTIWRMPFLEKRHYIDFLQPNLDNIHFVGIRKVRVKSCYTYVRLIQRRVQIEFETDIHVPNDILGYQGYTEDSISSLFRYEDDAVNHAYEENDLTYGFPHKITFLENLRAMKEHVIDINLAMAKAIKHLMDINNIPESFKYKDSHFHSFKSVCESNGINWNDVLAKFPGSNIIDDGNQYKTGIM